MFFNLRSPAAPVPAPPPSSSPSSPSPSPPAGVGAAYGVRGVPTATLICRPFPLSTPPGVGGTNPGVATLAPGVAPAVVFAAGSDGNADEDADDGSGPSGAGAEADGRWIYGRTYLSYAGSSWKRVMRSSVALNIGRAREEPASERTAIAGTVSALAVNTQKGARLRNDIHLTGAERRRACRAATTAPLLR